MHKIYKAALQLWEWYRHWGYVW